jgi:Xaa-Pro aminopeptidase
VTDYRGVDWEQGPEWAELRRYRVERLTGAMRKEGLDAVLFTRLDAIRYATSFRPIYSMWFYGTRYVAIVTAEGHITFLVASGDHARVAQTMPWLTDLVPFPFVMAEGVPLIVGAIDRLGLGKARIGLDIMPVAVLLALRESLPEVTFVDGVGVLEEARRIKHPVEVEMLRGAAALADIGMQAALAKVRDGVPEISVSTAAAAAMMEAGSEDIPYYPLVISGSHVWLKYRFPTAKRLRRGETVWIDCGACIYNGYNGDIARIAVVEGRVTEEQRRIYRTIYDMLQAVIEAARPGTDIETLNAAVMDVAREAGYEEFCAPVILGHGIGTDLHELPAIGEKVKVGGGSSAAPPGRLEPNMVISAEPGIIVPGVGGGHLEDMIFVGSGGPEVLTRTPFENWLLE